MKDKAIERINRLLLKRSVNIIKDDSIRVPEKKELLKELRIEKQRLIRIL